MKKAKKCTKCNGNMLEGEYGGLYGSFAPWARGKFFIKWIGERASHNIKVYRCNKCGYLESYAE